MHLPNQNKHILVVKYVIKPINIFIAIRITLWVDRHCLNANRTIAILFAADNVRLSTKFYKKKVLRKMFILN